MTERIWPNIELQWWLGGLPPLRKAAVIGAGSGTTLAVLLARGGLEVALGTRSEAKAERIRKHGENADYLPGVARLRG